MGNKGWSVLFGVVMLACGLSFVVAPFMGWWLPRGDSSHAWDVDFLFYVILYITAFFFVLTEAILVGFMWLYSSSPEGKRPISEASEPAGFVKPLANLLNNQHKVELAWTFIPAVILLYIAFAQVNAWANIKYESRKKEYLDEGKVGTSHQMAVSARQFEWRIRYPSVERFKKWQEDKNASQSAEYISFGKVPQADDVYVVNEVHIWENHPVVVHLSTRDVIHSFNLPNFRIKQDALPGKVIPVWFRTIDSKTHKTTNTIWDEKVGRYIDGINPETKKQDPAYTYDIACAELCGWGHYRMIGRVYVHPDKDDYIKWLEKAQATTRQRTRD